MKEFEEMDDIHKILELQFKIYKRALSDYHPINKLNRIIYYVKNFIFEGRFSFEEQLLKDDYKSWLKSVGIYLSSGK